MCGIVGVVRSPALAPQDRDAVEAMTASLRHRGPDGSGILERPGALLGHTRLAIVDLSDQASQPMIREEGDAAITYNGEVYNHLDLRRELEGLGHSFRSRSDTEVVLEGWRAWGEDLPRRLNGMFAFGVWDTRARTLLLARDRYGQKPLYYTRTPDGGLIFASELRALLAHPDVPRRLDRLAVAKYLAFDYLPGAATAIAGVYKLRPGEALLWEDGRVRTWRYFRSSYGGARITPREASHQLWQLLGDAVERHLMSDVPLGVFLSGGVDSSAVLAAMASRTDPARIHTFAIGFEEASFDESGPARAVAEHFGVNHHVQTLDEGRLLELLPEILDHMDEPLADVSIVPTYALSKFARQHVTVALGGDGGDELFAGYDTFLAERVAAPYLALPGFVHAAARRVVDALPPSTRKMSLQFRARRFVRGMDPDLYRRNQRWFGSFQPEEAALLVRGAGTADEVYEDLMGQRPSEQEILDLWTSNYLPEDVLAKVDRASMAVSLEVRAPLLDRELAAFVQSLPYSFKLRGLTRKWIFKRALRGRLPSAILRRKKQGFGAPNHLWLRGPLREELTRLVDPERLADDGVLDPDLARSFVREHLSGEHDHRKQVWALYVLERWRQRLDLR
jgi:asparagine synthase (glutamine-hydrolysing)